MSASILSDIFNLSRILGLFPFDEEFSLSKKWLIYAVLFQLINTIGGFFDIIFRIHYWESELNFWKIFRSIDVMDRLFAHFKQVFTVVYIVRRRDWVIKLFNDMNEVMNNQGVFSRYRFHYTRNCFLLIIFIEILPMILSINYPIYIFIIYYSVLIVNLSSTASVVGQVWDLMGALTILINDCTYELNECSIGALEHLTSIGESIGKLYGPLLLIVIVSCVPRMILDLYLILMQLYPSSLIGNIVVLLSALLGFFFVSSIAYSYCKFINQVIIQMYSYLVPTDHGEHSK